ncbi:ABC-F family ATP-binding cassette domain-containing protein [Paenisporosarcina cavernae]|uniref:ABC transporter ATP-binding protein n=1 Tax=Paenisporosarcina cavernae TaxID=2320858 RepID=A0A385YRR8_9BACL|nr:ABC-F family ATP-binding cassette domain-containing protein [Paenisporosarcina cavernae]AYC29439.1 ABC transporter ATP-binding protein [Paenisporosarcina cavernae]
MSHFIAQQITKTIGDKTLFHNIGFSLYPGQRVGLVGINGTGKSTLLHVLTHPEEADAISLDTPSRFRISYLPQEPLLDDTLTVLEAVFEGDSPLLRLNRKYENSLKLVQEETENEEQLNRLVSLQAQMEDNRAWDLNAYAKTALTKLGIQNFSQRISELSGGERKRVALAQVLLEESDLLLLDEPTNHLDVDGIKWLQETLATKSGSILFITHDRYFLDAVCTSIFELENGQLTEFTGDYSSYVEQKAQLEATQQVSEHKQAQLYKAELAWMRKGAKARTTKQKARIDRFETLQDNMPVTSSETLDIGLVASRLGNKVIEGHHIAKSFGSNYIVRDFSFLLQKRDRIGIVGLNGVGKSTLMKLLEGSEPLDAGTIEKGSTVSIAYFDQHVPAMNENVRMIEYIRSISNEISTENGERLSATQMLERFLFPTSVHGTYIHKLSGGERKRLYLLSLLMSQPNVLLLDEPTNDLDIKTLSVLEGFLEEFSGVVIVISHDRYFLDRIANQLWILDGNGNVVISSKQYTTYLEERLEKQPETMSKAVSVFKEVEKSPNEKKKKLSYHEKKEWETIEQEIEEMEVSIAHLHEALNNAGADYDKTVEYSKEIDRLELSLEEKMERWSYLQEIVES